MWREMARIIGEVRPQYAFIENSPMLTIRGLGIVLADLAKMGFDAKWGVLGADAVGACHHRERIWILANANRNGLESNWKIGNIKKARQQFRGWWSKQADVPLLSAYEHENACKSVRDDDVVAARVDRLKAIGNGQVPLCAATAWQILSQHE
jgi:DNA (cytosine-5)-methyltransferase 1